MLTHNQRRANNEIHFVQEMFVFFVNICTPSSKRSDQRRGWFEKASTPVFRFVCASSFGPRSPRNSICHALKQTFCLHDMFSCSPLNFQVLERLCEDSFDTLTNSDSLYETGYFSLEPRSQWKAENLSIRQIP